MNAILKKVSDIFGPGDNREVLYPKFQPEFQEVSAHPDGLFSFWMEKRAVRAMQNEFGLSVEEIKPLAGRVFEKCRELGLWHEEPVHFVLNAYDTKINRGWFPCKIEPPMPLFKNKIATRSIVVALQTTRLEDETLINTVLGFVLKNARFRDDQARQAFIDKELKPLIKAKHKMTLTHEMVHVFATDEYRPIMKALGLDLLELLTDAINMVTFYRDFKGADSFVKTGICEGAGYIVNLINRETVGGITSSPKMVELACQRSRRIIEECKERIAAFAVK